MTKISEVIAEADISEVCSPCSGDCESVAVALSRVFDVDNYVCIYEPGERQRASHATIEVNGTLYDGTGQTTREALTDYLGMFKPRDIDVESQAELETQLKDQIDSIPANPEFLSHDEQVADRVETELRKAHPEY